MLLKRTHKPNPNKKAISMKRLPDLNSAVFIFGRVGSSKSTTMKSCAELYHDELKYKLLFLWGGQRKEQNFIALPSNKVNYWNKVKKKFGFINSGPKQYQVNILYPFFEKTFPKKLPEYVGSVKSKIFTIPFKSLTPDIVSTIAGNLSEVARQHFINALEDIKDKDGAAIINSYVEKNIPKNSVVYRNILLPLAKNKFIQSKNYSYNIDLLSELKEQKTVTVLCLDYVPEQYRVFIMDYLLFTIQQLIDDGKYHRKTIAFIQEAAEFFQATEQAIVPEKMKVFRNHLGQHVRMGRRGVYLFLEAQSILETKGMVEGSQALTMLCNMTSDGDITASTDRLYKDGWMSDLQRRSLSSLKPGECFFVESNKKVVKRYFFMPRSMFWEPGMNFYQIWEKLRGTWKNTIDDINNINNNYKEEYNLILEKEKLDKIIAKKKAEELKLKKEKEDEDKKEEKIRKDIELIKKRQELKKQILGKKEIKKEVKKKNVSKEKVLEESDDLGLVEDLNNQIKLDNNINIVKIKEDINDEEAEFFKFMEEQNE